MVSFTTLIAFWKKKESAAGPGEQRIIPLPPSLTQQPSEPQAARPRTTSPDDVNRAREALKVLRLERQILSTALTTIYESYTKGMISQEERDRLIGKYKVDLTRLEKSIEENQRLVDLYDLELSREKLVKEFNSRLTEVDSQIKALKAGGSQPSSSEAAEKEQGTEKKQAQADQNEAPKKPKQSKQPAEEQQQDISDAEKRIGQIREEILKAMDRLEQIEAEG